MKKNIMCFLILCFTAAFGLSGMTFAMGRIPKKQYQAKVNELDQTKKECTANLDQTKKECASNLESLQKKMDDELAQAKLKTDSLESRNAQLLKDMESSKSDLQKRVAELTKEKQEVENTKSLEVNKLKSTYDNLVSDMKKEIDQGSIQITQLQNKLSVNLVDKILFNSGEAEVNEQGRQVLKRVANILKKVQDKQIRIEGHTDNEPIGPKLKDKFPSNWELSTTRATTVARYLQDAGGVDPKYLSASGYAEYRPIADNLKPEGRSKNRRIEIVLVPMEITSAQTTKTPVLPPPAKTPAKP